MSMFGRGLSTCALDEFGAELTVYSHLGIPGERMYILD